MLGCGDGWSFVGVGAIRLGSWLKGRLASWLKRQCLNPARPRASIGKPALLPTDLTSPASLPPIAEAAGSHVAASAAAPRRPHRFAGRVQALARLGVIKRGPGLEVGLDQPSKLSLPSCAVVPVHFMPACPNPNLTSTHATQRISQTLQSA